MALSLQVYTKEMIKDVVNYGLVRGIRVLPEFDAPAHVGEGWQDTNLTVCFKVNFLWRYEINRNICTLRFPKSRLD